MGLFESKALYIIDTSNRQGCLTVHRVTGGRLPAHRTIAEHYATMLRLAYDSANYVGGVAKIEKGR